MKLCLGKENVSGHLATAAAVFRPGQWRSLSRLGELYLSPTLLVEKEADGGGGSMAPDECALYITTINSSSSV
jgi:hypothetical protein